MFLAWRRAIISSIPVWLKENVLLSFNETNLWYVNHLFKIRADACGPKCCGAGEVGLALFFLGGGSGGLRFGIDSKLNNVRGGQSDFLVPWQFATFRQFRLSFPSCFFFAFFLSFFVVLVLHVFLGLHPFFNSLLLFNFDYFDSRFSFSSCRFSLGSFLASWVSSIVLFLFKIGFLAFLRVFLSFPCCFFVFVRRLVDVLSI